jgi:cysteine desulfurase / selenocysteine lyase
MTPTALRDLFPLLANPSTIWLNAAGSSPIATPVAQAVRAHLDDCVARGDRGYNEWAATRERLRSRLARLYGSAVRGVAFTQSTSQAFHVVGSLLWRRGVRRVLTLEGEFPSTTVPLLHLGFELEVLRVERDGSYSLAALEAALPRVGAVALSVVEYGSGYRIDLAAIANACRARGLPLALNAAQAAGQVPIDVASLGAGFVCGTGHKWLMGGYGLGHLALQGDWLEEPLPWAGWLSTGSADRWNAFPHSERTPTATGFVAKGAAVRRSEAATLEGGAGGFTHHVALEAALQLVEAVGVPQIQLHIQGLQAALRLGLRARGFSPNAPDAPEVGSGICVVPVQGEVEAAVKALAAQGVVVTARGGGVRLATHAYNTHEDVERGLSAFDRLGLRPP